MIKKLKYKIIQSFYRNCKSKPKGVAMFHFGRCGSTVVSELLNQNKNIKWDNELFQIIKLGKKKPFDVKYESDMFQILINRYSRTKEVFYGFETKAINEAHLGKDFLNMDFELYLDKLVKLGFKKFVILKRRNYFKQVFSIARGIENKQFHFKNEDKLKINKINFNPEKVTYGDFKGDLLEVFKRFENQYQHIENLIKSKGLDYLELFYEDHIEKDPTVSYGLICEYLGVQLFDEVSIQQKKIAHKNIFDEIKDPELVKNYLLDTEYSWMLNS